MGHSPLLCSAVLYYILLFGEIVVAVDDGGGDDGGIITNMPSSTHDTGRDDDPTVRGLALRSLCSLRLPNMVEYLEPAIRRALVDVNGYVRKTAVIGVMKLYYVCPDTVKGSDFTSLLQKLLGDSDVQVATNAIYALNEIFADEGGMTITRNTAIHLLNRYGTEPLVLCC